MGQEPETEHELLGAILYAEADVSASNILEALDAQMAGDDRRIGDILIDMGNCSPKKVLEALAKQHGCLVAADLGHNLFPSVIRQINREIALRYRVLPIGAIKNNEDTLKILTVAVGDPGEIVFVQDTLRFQLGCKIKVLLADKKELDDALLHYYGDEPTLAEQGIRGKPHDILPFTDPLNQRIKELEEERDELLRAFHAAITRPKGVVPTCGDKFYDQNHPALNRDTNEPKDLDKYMQGNMEMF